MRKSNAIVGILCTCVLSLVSFYQGVEAGNAGASGITYNSQGVIVFDDPDTADVEKFDASDFQTIDTIVTNGKTSIATEIKNHTGEFPANMDFATLASEIANIPTKMSQNGDFGNANAANVLVGSTFTSSNGMKIAGTMQNLNSSVTAGAVSESGDNAKIYIGATGKVTKNTSYVEVPVETLKNNVSSLNSSIIIEAVNSHISDTSKQLSSSASNQEIVAAITAYWTGGTASGNITYEYHYHDSTSNCYVPATICGTYVYAFEDSNAEEHHYKKCTGCGNTVNCRDGDGEYPHVTKNSYYSCGYSNGQILSATITY